MSRKALRRESFVGNAVIVGITLALMGACLYLGWLLADVYASYLYG